MLHMIIDEIWRHGEPLPPTRVGRAGMQTGIGTVQILDIGVLGGVANARKQLGMMVSLSDKFAANTRAKLARQRQVFNVQSAEIRWQ